MREGGTFQQRRLSTMLGAKIVYIVTIAAHRMVKNSGSAIP